MGRRPGISSNAFASRRIFPNVEVGGVELRRSSMQMAREVDPPPPFDDTEALLAWSVGARS
jgi:hypothetical protein